MPRSCGLSKYSGSGAGDNDLLQPAMGKLLNRERLSTLALTPAVAHARSIAMVPSYHDNLASSVHDMDRLGRRQSHTPLPSTAGFSRASSSVVELKKGLAVWKHTW